jgi:hypothetical protein
VKACEYCGSRIQRLLMNGRKFCSVSCRNRSRDERFKQDLPDAEIERRFQAAKTQQQWERRIGSHEAGQ